MKRHWACGLIAAALAAVSVAAAADPPVISARSYASGSVTVKVTGAFAIDATIPLNVPASISDGEMTWLQFGVSGAAEPNLLLTVSSYEVGFGVARGKAIATAGADDCKGETKVEPAKVSGSYKCLGVTSYDPGTGQMGKVDIEIRFSAL